MNKAPSDIPDRDRKRGITVSDGRKKENDRFVGGMVQDTVMRRDGSTWAIVLFLAPIAGVFVWGVMSMSSSSSGWPALIHTAPEWLGVWLGSVMMGLIVTILNMILALPAAKVLSLMASKTKTTIPGFFLLYAVLAAFGLTMTGTGGGTAGLILMIFIPTLPLSVLMLTDAYRSIGKEMMEQASTLGAGPMQVFWTITLPLLRPVIDAASWLVFSIAVGQSLLIWWLGGGRAIPVLFDANGNSRGYTAATVCQLLFVGTGASALIWMRLKDRKRNGNHSQGKGCG